MVEASVVTLNRGRRGHLLRLLEGLDRGGAPAECVVVEMGGDEGPLPAYGFPVRRRVLAQDGLPLAAARNAGRRAATGRVLVFLDVDCIPGAGLVGALAEVVDTRDALVCAEVAYLPAGAVGEGWTERDLDRLGRLHPARRFPSSGLEEAEHPGLFWSLAFAVRAATFDRVGGFDEGYAGYGAEDTDLAFRAARAGVPVLLAAGPRAYHQHHAAYDPPLQHFADIVRNATRFRERHGLWPMPGWLDAFAALGLIDPDRSAGITVLRAPTPDEIAAARLSPERAF